MRPGGLAGGGGAIVNVASVAATIPFPGIAGYSATKSAVDRLTRVAALESGKAVVVGDVRKDARYLPTFHTTRSEIIIPMVNEGKRVVGMLDAESEKPNAFGNEDRQFLERAAGLIAHCLH